MSSVKQLVVVIAMLLLAAFVSACATVNPQAQVETVTLAKTGETVYLFHGGNKLAKEEFCLNDLVPVYRFYYHFNNITQRSEEGMVKITGYEGDHFIKGVVVEGRIRNGDIAIKHSGATSCMIIVPESERE